MNAGRALKDIAPQCGLPENGCQADPTERRLEWQPTGFVDRQGPVEDVALFARFSGAAEFAGSGSDSVLKINLPN